jgi:cytochrome c-type biogenesis protein CcmE
MKKQKRKKCLVPGECIFLPIYPIFPIFASERNSNAVPIRKTQKVSIPAKKKKKKNIRGVGMVQDGPVKRAPDLIKHTKKDAVQRRRMKKSSSSS